MVRKPVETIETPVETPVETFTLSYPRLNLSVDASTLPESSVQFILNYGFKQLLSDASAGLKKEKGQEAADAAVVSRFESILSGTVGIRVKAERKAKGKTLDYFIAVAAKEKLGAIAASKGMTLPKGDKLASMLGKLAETESVKAIAMERYQAAQSASDDVSDEFLNELMEGAA
jgi:hypothetical protein